MIEFVRKKYVFFIISIFFSCQKYPTNDQEVINLVDSTGSKHGIWVDTLSGLVRSQVYVHGVQEGEFKQYSRIHGTLTAKGQYQNGQKTGVWRYFESKTGNLESEVSNWQTNDTIVAPNNGFAYIPPFSVYIRYFNWKHEFLVCEGQLLYSEDFEEDTSVRHGPWKFYRENDSTVYETIIYNGGVVVE